MLPKDINTPEVASQIDAAMEIKKSGNATKAQIVANKVNEAAEQQAAAAVVTPPTGDPSAVSAPVITNLSFEDRLRDRYEREYAEEKRKEQERLQRERLGHGVAGLAASIGDMIRASEGAPVNPRDWQQIYDNLTAQERANVNNYQVRMAKLREDARADRKASAQAQAQAEAMKQQRDYDYWKMMIERDDKLSEAEKNRMLQWMLGTMKSDTQFDIAKYKADHPSTPKKDPTKIDPNKETVFQIGSQSFSIPKGDTMVQFVMALPGLWNNDAYFKDEYKKGGSKYKERKKMSLISNQSVNTENALLYYKRNQADALSHYSEQLNADGMAKLEEILGTHQVSEITPTEVKLGGNTPVNATKYHSRKPQ